MLGTRQPRDADGLGLRAGMQVLRRQCRQPARLARSAEPANVADAVALMGLKYVVLTSVDRDDLDDLGAGHYAACIRAIHERMPQLRSALTPDFKVAPPGGRCSMPVWPPAKI